MTQHLRTLVDLPEDMHQFLALISEGSQAPVTAPGYPTHYFASVASIYSGIYSQTHTYIHINKNKSKQILNISNSTIFQFLQYLVL